MKRRNRLLALVLCLAMVSGLLAVPAAAADSMPSIDVPSGNQTEGNWVYEVSVAYSMGGGSDAAMGGAGMAPMAGTDDVSLVETAGMTAEGVATILWGMGAEKSGNVVMLPATLGGYRVATIGNGAQNISSNNKNQNVYVLIPDGVETLSPRMIYDYNSVSGWSVPASVTSIDAQALLSSAGTFFGVAGSAAETFTKADSTRDFVTYTADGSKTFTATADENGYMQPNGTYTLPSGMLDGEHSVDFTIVADYQHQIAALMVDGQPVAEAIGQNEYTLHYTFTSASTGVSVTFADDPDDSRDPASMTETYTYDAPAIVDGAVAEGAVLPDDVNEYLGVNTGSTEKYNNTMGVSTGLYYAADGKLYEQVYVSQTTEAPEYLSLAEGINGLYEKEGLVYGQDYDLIRVYNYYENQTSGPSQGVVQLYCTFCYKEISTDEIQSLVVDNSNTNTANIFVQEGGDVTLDDFVASSYTSSSGPSEAGNFFGLGSSIHVDGGDGFTAATRYINTDSSQLTLNQPQVLGHVNSMYATAHGVLYVQGGNIFSCSSGGHGPYVSTAGQILLNVSGTNLINDDNSVNTDVDSLVATTRPASTLGTMARDEDGEMQGVYQDHDDDVSVIVTGDEAGTALATDTGGGVIVANQATTKTFGLRCAGVYSIGWNESWVYCYNSTLTSYLDAGLCSASGGYIFAYNCDINGTMGIKTRSGGNLESDETGVYVNSSRVAASFDAEEMANAYDVGDPATMKALLESGELDVENLDPQSDIGLNIFVDKANTPHFDEDSLDWWFTDRSKTPGYSGGNKFAVIYAENSSTPIYVTASKLVNQNYVDYGSESDWWAEHEGQVSDVTGNAYVPADDLLISVEGAGSATVYFTDENSQTKWDQTGVSDETCELVGDFFLGAYSDNSSGSPDLGTGANALTASFVNSEWTGTILYGDDAMTGTVTLSFDADSSWTVTADTYVANLEIADLTKVTASEPVTVSYTSSSTVTPGTYGNVTFVRTFSDTVGHAYAAEIMKAVDAGLFQGVSDSAFEPDSTLTRAQVVQVLYNYAGKPAGAPAAGFGDVVSGAWYEAAINWAASEGLVIGIGNNQFAPTQAITRQQLAILLSRVDETADATALNAYVAEAPNAPVTRAEAAAQIGSYLVP
jgi:hypothetical protein